MTQKQPKLNPKSTLSTRHLTNIRGELKMNKAQASSNPVAQERANEFVSDIPKLFKITIFIEDMCLTRIELRFQPLCMKSRQKRGSMVICFYCSLYIYLFLDFQWYYFMLKNKDNIWMGVIPSFMILPPVQTQPGLIFRGFHIYIWDKERVILWYP